MNSLNINGKNYKVEGRNILVTNGELFVDGVKIEENLSGNVHLTFDGDLGSLNTDGDAVVNGVVRDSVDAGGSVTVNGSVGSIDAGGSVSAQQVDGDIDAGGSVTCQTAYGDIEAGGSVSIKNHITKPSMTDSYFNKN